MDSICDKWQQILRGQAMELDLFCNHHLAALAVATVVGTVSPYLFDRLSPKEPRGPSTDTPVRADKRHDAGKDDARKDEANKPPFDQLEAIEGIGPEIVTVSSRWQHFPRTR
jgi:hypothetical protein